MQNLKEKFKKHPKIHILLVLSAVVLFSLLAIFFIYSNGDHPGFFCSYSQTEFPLPDYLKDSKIIFEKPVYGMDNLGSGYGCLSAFSDSNHLVNTISPEQDFVAKNKINNGKAKIQRTTEVL